MVNPTNAPLLPSEQKNVEKKEEKAGQLRGRTVTPSNSRNDIDFSELMKEFEEDLHQGTEFVSQLFDDFIAQKFFGSSPIEKSMQKELKRSIIQCFNEFFPQLVNRPEHKFPFEEKLILEHSLISLSHFFTEYGEVIKKLKLTDLFFEGNHENKDFFWNELNAVRKKNNRIPCFKNDQEAQQVLFNDIVVMLRGCLDILQPYLKELNFNSHELLINCIAPLVVISLEEALHPQQICCLIQRFLLVKSREETKVISKEQATQNCTFEKLNSATKTLLKSLINLTDGNKIFKAGIKTGITFFLERFTSSIWNSLEESIKKPSSLGPLYILKNLLYTKKNEKWEVNTYINENCNSLSLIQETQKKLTEQIDQFVNQFFTQIPGKFGMVQISMISKNLQNRLFFLIKEPLFLKLLFHDLLVTLTKSLVHFLPPSAILQANFKLSDNYKESNSNSEITLKKTQEIFVRRSFFSESLSIFKVKKEVLPTTLNHENINSQIEKWKLAFKTGNIQPFYSEDAKKHLDFVKVLSTRILDCYMLPNIPVRENIQKFTQSSLLQISDLHLNDLLPLLVFKQPRDLSENEKPLIRLVLQGLGQYFEDYTTCINIKGRDHLLSHMIHLKKSRKEFCYFTNENELQNALYEKLIAILDKSQKLLFPLNKPQALHQELLICFQHLVASLTLISLDKFITPQNILTLIYRALSEYIVWNINSTSNPIKLPKWGDEFYTDISLSVNKLSKAFISLASPNTSLQSVGTALAALTEKVTNIGSKKIMTIYSKIQLSHYRIYPFTLLHFLLFKKTNSGWEPTLNNGNSPLKQIQKELTEIITQKVEKQLNNFPILAQLTIKAISIEELVKKIIILAEQPALIKLLIYDLMTKIDEAIDEIILNHL